MASTLRIWRVSDGRRGHDSQSQGLVEALSRRVNVHCQTVPVAGGLSGSWRVLVSPLHGARPALIVGAGHSTHLALLVAAWRHRARSVVLMKPSLPLRLFDLCIIPRHDDIAGGNNVLLSLGALNRIRPATGRNATAGLILVGGPSRHHQWDEAALLAQVGEVVRAEPGLRWEAAGSPRTPNSTLQALAGIHELRVVPFAETTPEWLPARLAHAAQVWVSEDSVSMAYEAVSGGAPTGVLEVPAARHGRVHAALDRLVEASLVTPFARWRGGERLHAPAPLQEADRCAAAILQRWPDLA